MTEPQDVLLAARDVLRERGWVRHTFEDDTGAVCLGGAIRVAKSGDAYGCHDAFAMEALKTVCWDWYSVGVSSANDHRIINRDEACTVLEEAAKRAANMTGQE